MEAIKAFLDLVKVAHPQSHKNLTLFPLLAPETGEPDFLPLEEALKQALLEITEVSEGGHVPMLNSVNYRRPRFCFLKLTTFLIYAIYNLSY